MKKKMLILLAIVLCLVLLGTVIMAIVLDRRNSDPISNIPQTQQTNPSEGTQKQEKPTDTATDPEEVTTIPTEGVTDPTHATEAPTQPTTNPNQGTTAPTQPSKNPTEPSEDPTEPSKDPTGPSKDPTGPSKDPTEPSKDPTEPSKDPTEPSKDPTKPSEDPTEPSEDSTEPSEDPTEPSEDPTEPSEDPTEPSKDPTEPSKDPTEPSEDPVDPPEEVPPSVEIPPDTDPETGEEVGISFPCQIPGYDLIIERMAAYSGMFVEDGSNVIVQNVAMLLVRNNGDTPIEYTQIRVVCGDEELLFDISALPAGEQLVVQEKTRKSIPEGDIKSATALIVQRADMEMSEGKVQVTDNGDNTLTIQNLTNKTIPTIRIFYKYYMKEERLFVGGIAFTSRITRLGPGASITIRASHYTSQTSKVVMVLTYDSEV